MRILLLTASILIGSVLSAEAEPAPREMEMEATAYCIHGTTKSGLPARRGVVAADPRVLPIGSLLRIVAGAKRGLYRVLDVGPAIQGRALDIFTPSCRDAIRFGRQQVLVRVLRVAKAIAPK